MKSKYAENMTIKNTVTDTVNRFEHHLDIKRTPLVPFKARNTKNTKTIYCNWHDNLEMLYFTEGSAVLHYGIRDIEVSAGELVIVNAQTMHSMTSETGVSFHMIIIDNIFFEENGIDITKYTFVPTTRDERIIKLYETACNEYFTRRDDTEPLAIARIRHAFLAFMIELCDGYVVSADISNVTAGGSEKYVKQAMEYINDNYTEKITLDGIAKEIGVNKSYFAREFRKYAGQTVHTYINNLRCTRADRCLSDGMSVTQAAMESGFGTLSYFSRTYRKLRGVSPASGRGKG